MNLRDVLKLDDFAGKTAEEVHDLFGETVELVRDSTAYTWSGVNEQLAGLGVDVMVLAVWDQALPSIPGGPMLANMLNSGGVDFTGPLIRAQLQSVAAGADPSIQAVLAALLEIGIRHGEWWRLWFDSIPTVEEIQSALVANQKESEWKAISNLVANLGAAGGGADEIKAAVAAWGN